MDQDWFLQAEDSLTGLPTSDNWDSYGGLATTGMAVARTRRILTWMRKRGLPLPLITPTHKGGIELSWGDEFLWITIDPTGRITVECVADDLSDL